MSIELPSQSSLICAPHSPARCHRICLLPLHRLVLCGKIVDSYDDVRLRFGFNEGVVLQSDDLVWKHALVNNLELQLCR
jgi:hypothetical protein